MTESSKRRLRLWLRLLVVTRTTENHLREFLRVHHDTTLPRFDTLAALSRKPEGVTMSELSRMLLVSNGNSTAVIDRLEGEGLVKRVPLKTDRRTILVSLTKAGTRQFAKLAEDHEREIEKTFADFSDDQAETLISILKHHKKSVHA